MGRRKSEKIPMNTAEAKATSIHLTPHNARSGVSAFKKRLRAQYGRREWNRELKVWVWERNTEPVSHTGSAIKRPESVQEKTGRPRRGIQWRLDDTMAQAIRDAGL